MLPFPAILAASHDDPAATIERSRAMAAEWVSDFVDVGLAGHINARSHLGGWPQGQRLLDILISGGPGLSRYTWRPEPCHGRYPAGLALEGQNVQRLLIR
jgi:hypothetical protein